MNRCIVKAKIKYANNENCIDSYLVIHGHKAFWTDKKATIFTENNKIEDFIELTKKISNIEVFDVQYIQV